MWSQNISPDLLNPMIVMLFRVLFSLAYTTIVNLTLKQGVVAE